MALCPGPLGIGRSIVVVGALLAASAVRTSGQTAAASPLDVQAAQETVVRSGGAPAFPRFQADERGRFGDYVNDVVGLWAMVGIVGRSGFDHVQEDPEEWGEDSEGFWKRLGSNAGRRVVQASVRHSLAAALGRTTAYQPCGCTSFGGKLGHAFLEAVTDHDEQGRRLFSVPQLAGNYAGSFAQLTWRPDGDAGQAVLNGTTAIVFTAAGNFLLTELLGFGK